MYADLTSELKTATQKAMCCAIKTSVMNEVILTLVLIFNLVCYVNVLKIT